MSREAMKTAILDLVRGLKGSVSFADLSNRVPGFLASDGGGFQMPYPYGSNIVIWNGMSEDGAAAVSELLKEFKIIIRPVGAAIYAMDGLIPQMPVAKKPLAYKEPRWLPMVIDLDDRSGAT